MSGSLEPHIPGYLEPYILGSFIEPYIPGSLETYILGSLELQIPGT